MPYINGLVFTVIKIMRKIFNLLISIGLLFLAVYYFGVDRIIEQAKNIKLEFFLFAIIINLLLIPIVTKRWQLILRLLTPLPNFIQCLRAQLVAMYAGLFFPGLISGTAVKLVLMRQIGIRSKYTLLSILFDKIAIVLPLVTCIAISVPFIADTHVFQEELDNFPKVVAAVFLVFISIIAGALLIPRLIHNDSMVLKNLLQLHKGKIAAIFLWGIVVVCMGVLQYWTLFEFNASLADLFLVTPAVIFISSLPLSIGGWGLREGSGILFFALIDIPGEVALLASVQVGFAGIIVSMIGAFFWSKDLIPEGKKAMSAAIAKTKN
ncbi:lysylphosphatidylglycerol synthase transmembrane domain-containing protein [Curvivirga aplysinae]|uniref:lysylphosphatidylglycerol synthase transmembrane domain-containing protein n=1 Tax=Curvivirga aplysinae TaxID=2529852 RepID=UPI0012BC74AD|nr:lysylphosphatidylglycerol synthase transmembrane domain-containing protein [Curvivirga aplysinae]MTI10606.1 flippase-like domain-containing protein [Curvivirga aplysinae]